MRKLFLTAPAAAIAVMAISAADWPTQSGSPQRDGWARAEKAFTTANAKDIELLYKYQADNKAKGPDALTTPLVNGMLITYLGFKEMLVFGGSDDNVYSIDADLNRKIWKRHFDTHTAPAPGCQPALTAGIAMPGSSSVAGRGGFGPGGGRGLFATGFGRSGVFITVSSDGFLHALNTSTGEDKVPPVKFVPPNSKLSALNINDSVVYAATVGGCGGQPGIYAVDMSNQDDIKQSSFNVSGTSPAGTAGTAIAADGTVYAQLDSVYALTKDLKPKDFFGPLSGDATPLAFQWKTRNLVIAGGGNGQLYLLDGAAPGGPDHKTPLSQSVAPDARFHGAFSSWDDNGVRWIYSSIWGRTRNGVIAYKVEDHEGAPVLTRSWMSADIPAPGPTVTANGLVFVLSSGEPSGHAVLHVLDGATGKELYSSGNTVKTFAHDAGLAIANRRIYFTTHDNTVYAFGFMADQPQLTGK